MKMLKKLLAVVLTGAMALTLFTACGGNAVSDKDIADALTGMAKAEGTNATFTPRAKERELARKMAALVETAVADGSVDLGKEAEKIIGYDKGGANADNFVWIGMDETDELGASGQAYRLAAQALKETDAKNYDNLHEENKKPADDRYMGTALCKIPDDYGNLVPWRVIVVTAKSEGLAPQRP